VRRGLFLALGASAALIGGLAGHAGAARAAFPPSPSWQTNGTVRVVIFSGNTLYVGGQFTRVRPPGVPVGTDEVVRNGAAAFNATTGALLKWNPNVNGNVRTIAVVKTRVYLGGTFTSVGGKARSNIAAVATGTGAVAKWNPGASRSVFIIRAGPNGNLFVGGDFSTFGGHTRHHLAEVGRGVTAPVAAWAPSIGQISGFACPPRCSPRIFTIAFSTNGQRVYFGGHFGTVDGVDRNEIAAVPISNGGQVLAFNPNIYAAANCPACTTVETSRVYKIIATSSRIYTCGGYWKVNGTKTSYNVSAFDPNSGNLITAFNQQDDGDTPGCAMRNQVLYVGGHFNFAGPNCKPGNTAPCSTRHHVAAFDTTDNQLLPWNPDANSAHGLLTIANGGTRMAFGGYFTRMGGTNQQGFALYQASHLP
jgi:trimeric autotransporter adhesin